MFIKGQEYRRTDLHEQWGGQRQGGISTPSNYPLLLLFTGDAGEQYGYSDNWKDGVFFYVGEGQRGDMELIRGNAAIHNHISNGKDLHLFSYVRKGFVRYDGQMVCIGFHHEEGPDIEGTIRGTIVFELTPLESFNEDAGSEKDQLDALSLRELRIGAWSASASRRDPVQRKQNYYYRSQAIKLYAQKRAHGKCEGCGQPAPFKTKEGTPYLEVHHIRRLSDGGPDDPRWVVAICANCHRRAHYSEDAVSFNKYLAQVALAADQAIGV